MVDKLKKWLAQCITQNSSGMLVLRCSFWACLEHTPLSCYHPRPLTKSPCPQGDNWNGAFPSLPIDELLTNREATFAEYRKKLLKAQERMKQVVDTKRRDVTFNTGDWVMVKLRPYRQTTVTGIHGGYLKLTKRFYGPF